MITDEQFKNKAREYIAKKQAAKTLNHEISSLKDELLEVLRDLQSIDVGNGFILELQERHTYDYDPQATKLRLLPLNLWEAVKDIRVDKKKIEGLVKAKILQPSLLKECKRTLSSSETILIKPAPNPTPNKRPKESPDAT